MHGRAVDTDLGHIGRTHTHSLAFEAFMYPTHTRPTAHRARPPATLLAALTLLTGACSDRARPVEPPAGGAVLAASFGKGSNGSSRIAFASDRDVPGGSEIYTINPDGTGVTRLTFTAAATNTSPAWSPDRKRVAFMSTRTDPLGEIYVMNADGSYLTRLTFSGGADDAPAWSTDGKRIAFTSTRGGDTDVYVMNADGSDQTRLTDSPGPDEHPAFSPDGKKIAFVSARQAPAGLTREVYVMNADGSGQAPVTAMQEIASYPTWAPGGKQIAFSTGAAIYVIGTDGTGLRELVAAAFDPTYSPDGKSIAFATPRDGSIELYTANADGSAQTRITFETFAGSFRPSWGR